MISLPIDSHLVDILQKFKSATNLILKAAPGSGKTTRLPAALVKGGYKKILVLVPKRIAAVSAADRIATENNWQLGKQVGYHVRFEPVYTAETALIFMTEGVFMKKAQDEKFWATIDVLIFDEFHERSALVDMALGLALEKQIVTDKLKLVVMSATLSSDSLQKFLPNTAAVEVKASPHPLDLKYSTKPQRLVCDTEFYQALVQTVGAAWTENSKDLLVFLPGFSEMRKAQVQIQKKFPAATTQFLHGSLKLHEQREILREHSSRWIILATDVAESSLTLPQVDAVIDSGLKKQATSEAKVGFSQLALQRISKFSATQRAGRAARTGPGRCYRLWHESDERSMPDQIKPEILKPELAAEVLTLKACAVDSVTDFLWLDPPKEKALDDATRKLKFWKLLDSAERITPLGLQIQKLPLSLENSLLFYQLAASGFHAEAAHLMACLETLDFAKVFSDSVPQKDDDLERLDSASLLNSQGLKIRTQLTTLKIPVGAPGTNFRKKLISIFFSYFPEKISQKKTDTDGVSSLGRGLTFLPGLQARYYEYQILLAGYNTSERTDIYFAIGFSKAEFLDFSSQTVEQKTEHVVDLEKRQIFKVQTKKVGRFIISESAKMGLTADEERNAWPHVLQQERKLLVEAHPEFQVYQLKKNFLMQKLGTEFLPENEFADRIAEDLTSGTNSMKSFFDYPLQDLLLVHTPPVAQKLLSQLPNFITLPSGRRVEIDYHSEKAPMISAKIQDFYGLKDTPTVLEQKMPLTLQLLAPSLRPTQITQNLRLFWEKSYFEIRKELRARYPKQQWPDNPADYKLEKKKS